MALAQNKNMLRKRVLAAIFILTLGVLCFAPMLDSVSAQSTITPSVILTSNLGGPFFDPFYGNTLTEVQQNSTLNVTVAFQTGNQCPTSGCDLSVGFALDTIPNFTKSTGLGYTNASNANPSSPLVALPHQDYEVALSILVPSNASNLFVHNYAVNIVNISTFTNTTTFLTQTVESVIGTSAGTIAIISPQQESFWIASQNLTLLSSGYARILNSSFSSQSGYQYSKAAGFYANSSSYYARGEQAYSEGNFAQASNYMNSALSEFNQAVSSYQSSAQSVASSNSSYLSFLSEGALLFGIGIIIAGIGVVIRGIRKSS